MAKLRDFVIADGSGGLVTNKSDYEMARNEFKKTLNLDFDERGKFKRRRGIQQWGDTKSGTIDESLFFSISTLGDAPTSYHVMLDRASNATLYRIVGDVVTAAIATSDTVITFRSVAFFAASGTVEINGDLIAYTGKAGATLTGCTGILKAHAAGSIGNQIISVGATGVDTRSGAYLSVLNNVLFINGRVGSATWDGSSITAVSDADEPAGICSTNYRDRIYVIGSGATDASGTRNGSPLRVSFSDAGDATSWDINNLFDVEDDLGESLRALVEHEDILVLFKFNSIHTYDEVQLKQRIWNAGAYNQKVVKKINDVIYTFCPTGVYETNGFSARKISDPVKEYLKEFKPAIETIGRAVTNTFAGVFEDKYLLYIGDITEPEVLTDVVLVFDTIRRNWTIYDGFTDFTHLGSLTGINQGDSGNYNIDQALFAGDSNGKYWRLFENRYLDFQSTRTYQGGDIVANLISNSNGNALSTVLETPYHTLGNLDWKEIEYLAAMVERGDFQISYSLDIGSKKTDWESLGDFRNSITFRRLKNNLKQGYRMAFRVTNQTANTLSIFNGLVAGNIETMEEKRYADFLK